MSFLILPVVECQIHGNILRESEMKVLSLGLAVTQGNTEVKIEQNKTNKQ